MPTPPLRPALFALFALFATLSLVSCDRMPDEPDLAAVDPAAHAAEVEAWRAQRVERLQSEDGWLTLAGLFWLEEGDSTLGADPSKDVVFPAGAPADVGLIRRQGTKVEIELAPGVEATIGGEARTRGPLSTDEGGATPTEVRLGRFRFFPLYREGRIALRLKDSEAPTRLEFHGIDAYPIDPAFRVVARFEATEGRSIQVPNVWGEPTAEPSPGVLAFELAGAKHTIEAMEGGDDELFLVFGDTTNGKDTYGGGRFLYVPKADEDGRIVVDFNRAYNPPCVFTPYATCPLPPPQNRLTVAVTAGEKNYVGGAHS